MNAICCSLLLQPVKRHTKNKISNPEKNLINKVTEIECHYCQSLKKKSHSIFSSQYLHNSDNVAHPGYEIIDPGFQMMAKANDGWFSSSSAKRSLYGSKMSLTSRKLSERDSKKASNQNLADTKPKLTNEIRGKIEECPSEDCPSHKSPQDLHEKQVQKQHLTVNSIRSYKTSPTTPTTINPFFLRQVSESKYLKDNKSNHSTQGNQSFRMRANTFNVEKEILNVARNKLEQYVNDTNERTAICTCEEARKTYERHLELSKVEENAFDEYRSKFTLWQKVVIFFDLDLLKDLTYLNIMIGN